MYLEKLPGRASLNGAIRMVSLHAVPCCVRVAHAPTGDMIYFHVLGQEVVVLNSAAIAHDLLDKRSSIYSYRPFLTMANEV